MFIWSVKLIINYFRLLPTLFQETKQTTINMSFAETLFTKIVAGEIPSFKVYEVSIHLYRDDIPITKIINLFFCLYLFPYIHHLTLFSHRYVHSHVSPIHHKNVTTKQKSTNTNPSSK